MPLHVHCILFIWSDQYNLNTLVSNGKRFVAHEIIKRLEAKGVKQNTFRLKEGLTERGVSKGQKHKVFEESF